MRVAVTAGDGRAHTLATRALVRASVLAAVALAAAPAAVAQTPPAPASPGESPDPASAPQGTERLTDLSTKGAGPASAPAAADTPLPPAAPPFGEAGELEEEGAVGALQTLIRMALALGAVVLLAYLLLHKGLGALSGRLAKGRLVRVVDRIGLEPKKALYVVEVAGRYYLIGTTDHGVSCLATLDEAAAKAAFEDLLRAGAQAGKGSAAPKAATQGGKDG